MQGNIVFKAASLISHYSRDYGNNHLNHMFLELKRT